MSNYSYDEIKKEFAEKLSELNAEYDFVTLEIRPWMKEDNEPYMNENGEDLYLVDFTCTSKEDTSLEKAETLGGSIPKVVTEAEFDLLIEYAKEIGIWEAFYGLEELQGEKDGTYDINVEGLKNSSLYKENEEIQKQLAIYEKNTTALMSEVTLNFELIHTEDGKPFISRMSNEMSELGRMKNEYEFNEEDKLIAQDDSIKAENIFSKRDRINSMYYALSDMNYALDDYDNDYEEFYANKEMEQNDEHLAYYRRCLTRDIEMLEKSMSVEELIGTKILNEYDNFETRTIQTEDLKNSPLFAEGTPLREKFELFSEFCGFEPSYMKYNGHLNEKEDFCCTEMSYENYAGDSIEFSIDFTTGDTYFSKSSWARAIDITEKDNVPEYKLVDDLSEAWKKENLTKEEYEALKSNKELEKESKTGPLSFDERVKMATEKAENNSKAEIKEAKEHNNEER